MKGEFFNLLEQFIVDNFGEHAFETIFHEIHSKLITKDPFVGPGTYPDSDFLAILGHAVETVGISLEEATYDFGRFCFQHLAQKVIAHVNLFSHPKPFLMTTDRMIHVEVKKIYRDAEPPRFNYIDTDPSRLTMIYFSKRRMFDLVEGLIAGVADHFQHPITVSRCVKPECCEFVLQFSEPYKGTPNV